MKRSLAPDRPRHDRWLVSYADLVTLLLACFATAFAASSQPHAEPQPPPEKHEPAPMPAIVEAVQVRPTIREIVAPAIGLLGGAPVELVQDARGLVISLPESATFSSGSADLTEEARTFLSRLATELRPTSLQVRIEGHTDDRPVRGGRYTSNWELSTARASAVVLYLVTDASFEPSRLSAAGYGEFHPRAANDGPDNRARNRRVDVVVFDRAPATAEQRAEP